MQFIDLATQQKSIRKKIENRIQTVLDHGKYIMGPEINELETTLAQYVGVKHAISCSSGTDALLMALMAYDVGPGDAIFTSPFTFIATAEVIALLGATPIFVDIDPATFNMDPLKLELAIKALVEDDPNIHPLPTSNKELPTPKGIIPVDLFGLPADYDQISAIAEKNGLFVLEDAAQSFGGQSRDRMACSLAETACTSFFPAKPLGCYGDGGMCFTDDEQLAGTMISIRIHGKGTDKYDNVRVGINGRLDSLQAAILLAKFEIFPEEIQIRQEVARRYDDLLFSPAAKEEILIPQIPSEMRSAWAQYSILTRNNNHRKELQNRLKEAGIPSAIYYPVPLHLQTAFEHLGYVDGNFPISEDYSQRIMSLPMHPYLAAEEQERIVRTLSK